MGASASDQIHVQWAAKYGRNNRPYRSDQIASDGLQADRRPTDRRPTDRPQTIGHSKTPKSMKETRPFGNGSVITIPFRRGGRLREMLYNPINHTISTRHFSAQKTTSKCRTSTQIDVTVLVQNYIHKVLSINLLKANYNPDMKVLN